MNKNTSSAAKKFFHCLLCALLSLHAAQAAVSPTPTPAPAPITLRDFRLTGNLGDDRATFTLTAIAHVENAKGGSLDLLSGTVALTDVGTNPRWRIGVDQNRFVLNLDRSGDHPIQVKFSAAVTQSNGWNTVDFRVAPSSLQPIVIEGLGADTQFQFIGAARPERTGSNFTSYLPPDGAVKLSWKEARKEEEGKLFFASEMLSQISIGPGLMRQVSLLEFKVMQGELNRVALRLRGAGEITRVQGDQVLAWDLEPVAGSTDRRLVVRLNQPQKDVFAIQVQMQTPLGAFPQSADAMQLRPESATRFAGYFRIVNDGAVRLEVAQASGLSQISPEQFPESDATRALLRVTGNQRFAYRFSGADFALRVQADQILPELAVSQVLAYRLSENELDIDAEIELDIREAPLRELLLSVPKGYAVARLTASGLSDYFLREPADEPTAELRLVYGQPVADRQVVQLRLERNQPLGATNWVLPRIEVRRAKSVRGHVGVAADAGFRLTAQRTVALTDIATAFFPRRVTGLQAAFRLSDPAWEATMNVERLPQTIQTDALHLFSIGEGIAYGSSVINYVVTGSPVAAFRVELSPEYSNVEFTGKDVRSWSSTNGVYTVQLHTPIAGSYTLLAAYERPFKPQGETLAFTGARPLDVQAEQGYTLVTSAYQFDVTAAELSAGLLELQTGEVPPEYRLFFDAAILKAYRYTSRPFNLRLALSPLTQGDSLNQVVDRASITNRISKEGQVLTEARYFVKNRGNSHFRLILPDETALWSATVNNAAVVPVKVGKVNLIPLPQRADPNAVLTIDLKLAKRFKNPRKLTIAAPIVTNAPVMLAEWTLEPDAGRRLVFRDGSLTPAGGVEDVSGFAGLSRTFGAGNSRRAWNLLFAGVVLVGISVVVWRWTGRTRRSSATHYAGLIAGAGAFALALLMFVSLGDVAEHANRFAPTNLKFLAPVQQSGSALQLVISNLDEKPGVFEFVGNAWPVAIALAVWFFGLITGRGALRSAGWIAGWTLLAWAALGWPNGAQTFILVLAAYLLLHVAIPALRQLWRTRPSARMDEAGAPAVIALLLGGLILTGAGCTGVSATTSRTTSSTNVAKGPAFAESITQQIRVEEKFALATAKIHWRAEKGDVLPLLFEPAVLTKVSYPTKSLKLAQSPAGERRAQRLIAQVGGVFDIELQYQVQVGKRGTESGFTLPTQYGLVNQLEITLANLDVDVVSSQAVSVQRSNTGTNTNTVATLVLSPASSAWIGWKPRTRDVKRETPVFYAEIHQLYVPAAGVIEGSHYAALRPAQGELGELVFNVPTGATITDVIDPGNNANASIVSLWRFDPDTRKLRVNLKTPQSRPFALMIRSQVATGPLPIQQSVGLISVENAAGQFGFIGVATGSDVQLDTVDAAGFSSINLEDFPGVVAQPLRAQIPSLTVRRAFRYDATRATALLRASAVEPDVRVETQTTLSLGEDRTVLAANAGVTITRAGIFRLSFVLPAALDVESITGAALSHWTELKSDAGRIITLHLRGKTEGQQQFAITLTGPGLKATNGWETPKLVFREASKQQGSLLLVPEQGMRLQVAARDGVTQLDPKLSGVRQKGVLAFRILQTPWNLSLDVEQVDPWIQVTSLQHATVNEAQVKVAANLQYQIENTGLKAFRVLVPANAEGVRFQGDQVLGFSLVAGAITNGMQEWEVQLQRRVIGQYLLQVTYQVRLPERATETALRGVQAADVNTQRGFLTVQSAGRLQLKVDATPETLQPAEYQSIPRALQPGLQSASANFCYRLVEASFQLPLKLERHEAAVLLPARVQSVTFTSVISDDGVMLTQARLDIIPGDLRLLEFTLPKGASFWFAFVNQNGVWPWRKQDKILIPLDQQTRNGRPMPVEFFYSSKVGESGSRSLDLGLQAPKFELPLENITWRVHMNEKWQVKSWAGSLQLQGGTEQVVPAAMALNSQAYLDFEANVQREKTKEAEQMLFVGNAALEKGEQRQARQAFQAAYGLSQGDNAFNEDARVQLNNLKLQQALVGLNVRQSAASGDTGALGGKLRDLRENKEVAYTQQDAKQIIDGNTADDNAAFMRLAERLVQQQDLAVSSPAAIHASIPQQGRVLTFKRAVVVDRNADLTIGLKAAAVSAASWTTRILILAATFIALGLLAWASRPFRRRDTEAEGV